jgi:hypothetical protein
MLGDLVSWHDPDSDIHPEAEAFADEIEEGFRGTRPLSEIIVEEREQGR